MFKLTWANPAEREHEFKVATDYLKQDGQKRSRKTTTFFSKPLKHSFIKLHNKIYAITHDYKGSGAFGRVKYLEDQTGNTYLVKIFDAHIDRSAIQENKLNHFQIQKQQYFNQKHFEQEGIISANIYKNTKIAIPRLDGSLKFYLLMPDLGISLHTDLTQF